MSWNCYVVIFSFWPHDYHEFIRIIWTVMCRMIKSRHDHKVASSTWKVHENIFFFLFFAVFISFSNFVVIQILANNMTTRSGEWKLKFIDDFNAKSGFLTRTEQRARKMAEKGIGGETQAGVQRSSIVSNIKLIVFTSNEYPSLTMTRLNRLICGCFKIDERISTRWIYSQSIHCGWMKIFIRKNYI